MIETDTLLSSIIAGAQEKKAKKIVTIDLSSIEESICKYFVVCEGTSNSHIMGVTDSIKNFVRTNLGEYASATDGYDNAQWIAIDYGDIMVHIFNREARQFYDIEHLWGDARIQEIADLD